MGCPEPAVGGTAGLLDPSGPNAASSASDDERLPPIAFAFTVGASALVASAFIALRLRR
jgi:hypothetical protein